MQEILKKLERVQELDLQIGTLEQQKAEFPKRLSQYDEQLKTLNTKIEEKKKIIEELERNKRQQLGALELNEERIKRSQEKLDQIRTNQEYQAVLKEIDSLKKNSTVIRENADKVIAELEMHDKEHSLFLESCNEAQSKKEQEEKIISQEEKVVQAELNQLQNLRREGIIGIDSRYLAIYDRIRTSRYGIGIVAAVSGNCRGCNMRIPPQIYNELQRGTEIHVCPSCRRILIFKDFSTNSSASASH